MDWNKFWQRGKESAQRAQERADRNKDGTVDREDMREYQKENPDKALLLAGIVGAALCLVVVLFLLFVK